MSISAYHTAQIDHVYEPLYLVIYGHYEKPGGSTCIIGCKHTRLRLEFLNLINKYTTPRFLNSTQQRLYFSHFISPKVSTNLLSCERIFLIADYCQLHN